MTTATNCLAYRGWRRLAAVNAKNVRDVIRQSSRFIWLDLHEPDEVLLAAVQEELRPHDLAIADATCAYRPLIIENRGEWLFVALRTAQFGDRPVEYGELRLIIGPNFLVSIWRGASSGFSEYGGRFEHAPRKFLDESGAALHTIMAALVAGYRHGTAELQQELRRTENCTFSDNTDAWVLKQSDDLSRTLLDFGKAGQPLIDLCTRLLDLRNERISDAARIYLRAVQNEAKQMVEEVDGMREMAEFLVEINRTLVSFRHTDRGKRASASVFALPMPFAIFTLYRRYVRAITRLSWARLYRKIKRSGWL